MANQLGAFIVDVQAKELTAEEKEILAHPLVGGVIFFTRNYESRQQLSQLSQAIRSARKTPLLLMVDQEGGRVQRFIPEFTRIPRMGVFGQWYAKDPNKARQLAKDCGWLMAVEILSLGIDLSLAPVLDINSKISTVIGDRAFHEDPRILIELASAFIAGMQEAGMAATGKHFPGHGTQAIDSHVGLPEDTRHLDAILGADLIPFQHFINAGIPALMAAHIVFPQVDHLPVGFSRIWLHDILRKRLGFKGVIFSDDLNMQGAAISTDYADRFNTAREAGCDFVMLCNNRAGVIQVLDKVSAVKHMIDQEKWARLQAKTQPTNFTTSERWKQTSLALQDSQ